MAKWISPKLFKRDGFHGLRTGPVEMLLPRTLGTMPAGTKLLHWDWVGGWMRVGKTVAAMHHPHRLAGGQRARRRTRAKARAFFTLSAEVKVLPSGNTAVTDAKLERNKL